MLVIMYYEVSVEAVAEKKYSGMPYGQKQNGIARMPRGRPITIMASTTCLHATACCCNLLLLVLQLTEASNLLLLPPQTPHSFFPP